MASRPANGYVPASALVKVESAAWMGSTVDFYLEPATAAAYLAAKAASGNTIRIAPPGGAYRSYQQQADMKAGRPSVAYWNLNPSSLVGLASAGYSSHGYATCVDIIGNNSWMLSNGARFGFSRPFGDRDHNHWQYGAPTWEQAALAGNQRRVLPTLPVRRRIGAPSTSAPTGEELPAGTVGNFDGWIYGESVSGNNVWFRGISGDWFWSGGFTDTGTHDLTNLNPPPAPTGKRTVLATLPVRVRSTPSTAGTVLGEYTAGSEQTFAYWTKGESVTGNGLTTDVWYVTSDKKNFSWAGGFTSQATAGLTELPVVDIPKPTWPTDVYSFQPAGDFVDRVVPADWSNFENEYSQPDPAQRKGFPDLPAKVVVHQWGDPGLYTINSVINTFKGRHENTADRVSAHFVVDGNEIVQMVSLDDRAYHAGAGGNDFVGIEADPKMTPEVVANVRRVLEFLRDRNGGEPLPIVLHRDVPGAATSCGSWINPHLPELDVTIPDEPEEPEEPVDPEPEEPGDDTPNWFVRFIQAVVEFLTGWLKK